MHFHYKQSFEVSDVKTEYNPLPFSMKKKHPHSTHQLSIRTILVHIFHAEDYGLAQHNLNKTVVFFRSRSYYRPCQRSHFLMIKKVLISITKNEYHCNLPGQRNMLRVRVDQSCILFAVFCDYSISFMSHKVGEVSSKKW